MFGLRRSAPGSSSRVRVDCCLSVSTRMGYKPLDFDGRSQFGVWEGKAAFGDGVKRRHFHLFGQQTGHNLATLTFVKAFSPAPTLRPSFNHGGKFRNCTTLRPPSRWREDIAADSLLLSTTARESPVRPTWWTPSRRPSACGQ